MNRGKYGYERKDLSKGNGKETEKRKAVVNEGEGKANPQANEIMEAESNVEAKDKTDQTRMKDQDKKTMCNVQIENTEATDEIIKGEKVMKIRLKAN